MELLEGFVLKASGVLNLLPELPEIVFPSHPEDQFTAVTEVTIEDLKRNLVKCDHFQIHSLAYSDNIKETILASEETDAFVIYTFPEWDADLTSRRDLDEVLDNHDEEAEEPVEIAKGSVMIISEQAKQQEIETITIQSKMSFTSRPSSPSLYGRSIGNTNLQSKRQLPELSRIATLTRAHDDGEAIPEVASALLQDTPKQQVTVVDLKAVQRVLVGLSHISKVSSTTSCKLKPARTLDSNSKQEEPLMKAAVAKEAVEESKQPQSKPESHVDSIKQVPSRVQDGSVVNPATAKQIKVGQTADSKPQLPIEPQQEVSGTVAYMKTVQELDESAASIEQAKSLSIDPKVPGKVSLNEAKPAVNKVVEEKKKAPQIPVKGRGSRLSIKQDTPELKTATEVVEVKRTISKAKQAESQAKTGMKKRQVDPSNEKEGALKLTSAALIPSKDQPAAGNVKGIVEDKKRLETAPVFQKQSSAGGLAETSKQKAPEDEPSAEIQGSAHEVVDQPDLSMVSALLEAPLQTTKPESQVLVDKSKVLEIIPTEPANYKEVSAGTQLSSTKEPPLAEKQDSTIEVERVEYKAKPLFESKAIKAEVPSKEKLSYNLLSPDKAGLQADEVASKDRETTEEPPLIQFIETETKNSLSGGVLTDLALPRREVDGDHQAGVSDVSISKQASDISAATETRSNILSKSSQDLPFKPKDALDRSRNKKLSLDMKVQSRNAKIDMRRLEPISLINKKRNPEDYLKPKPNISLGSATPEPILAQRPKSQIKLKKKREKSGPPSILPPLRTQNQSLLGDSKPTPTSVPSSLGSHRNLVKDSSPTLNMRPMRQAPSDARVTKAYGTLAEVKTRSLPSRKKMSVESCFPSLGKMTLAERLLASKAPKLEG
mmetsp:Transcript_13248/g.24835  ORF Transcript_13248/g.24835 Transcript_13248/m.24835 type:complete len:886 (-) Transcript_13248:2267-4924(-)